MGSTVEGSGAGCSLATVGCRLLETSPLDLDSEELLLLHETALEQDGTILQHLQVTFLD